MLNPRPVIKVVPKWQAIPTRKPIFTFRISSSIKFAKAYTLSLYRRQQTQFHTGYLPSTKLLKYFQVLSQHLAQSHSNDGTHGLPLPRLSQ